MNRRASVRRALVNRKVPVDRRAVINRRVPVVRRAAIYTRAPIGEGPRLTFNRKD